MAEAGRQTILYYKRAVQVGEALRKRSWLKTTGLRLGARLFKHNDKNRKL